MPVGEMLRRLDSRELTEWRAYFELKGEERDKATRQGRKGGKGAASAADIRAAFANRVARKK